MDVWTSTRQYTGKALWLCAETAGLPVERPVESGMGCQAERIYDDVGVVVIECLLSRKDAGIKRTDRRGGHGGDARQRRRRNGTAAVIAVPTSVWYGSFSGYDAVIFGAVLLFDRCYGG